MPVYLIAAGNTGIVKIGWTLESVEARLQNLQCGNHEELVVVGTINGGPWVERVMHKHFADRRVKGEWFRFHEDMLTFDPLPHTPVDHVTVPKQYPPAVQRVLAQFGPTQLAAKLGISPSAVSNWTQIPSRHVPVISTLTRIPAEELRPDMYCFPDGTRFHA